MSICKLATLFVLLAGLSIVSVAQSSDTTSSQSPQKNLNREAGRPNADETFDLNIDSRRITEENFAASTAVGTDENSSRLDLQIGVALSAARIDVLLRNVRGHVRFRGSLERVLDVLNVRRSGSPR